MVGERQLRPGLGCWQGMSAHLRGVKAMLGGLKGNYVLVQV
jgi:hypothetical protein